MKIREGCKGRENCSGFKKIVRIVKGESEASRSHFISGR